MRKILHSMLAVGLLLALAAGCTAVTGKTLGENIDDASITATVKAKLAGEQFATLTRIDVDTHQGTVFLTGTVKEAGIRTRAAEVAGQVKGVRGVVNNLRVEG